MAADLCKHDLNPASCADCNPPSWRETALAPEYGPWFTAGYYGSCTDCDSDIEPGDTIRADGEGGYLCQVCGQTGEDRENV